MKKQGIISKLWGVVYPPVLYMLIQEIVAFVFIFLAVIITEILLSVKGISLGTDELTEFIINNVYNSLSLWLIAISALLTMPFVINAFNKDTKAKKQMPGYVRYKRVSPFKYLLIVPFAVCGMYAGSLVSNILSMVMPSWFYESYSGVEDALYSGSIYLQIAVIVIIAPLIEEMIFRVLVYNRIKRMSNVKAAAILSALFFGVFHLNFVQGVYAFIIGILLVYVYEKYKSMWAPFVFHASANGFSLLISTLATDSADTSDIVTSDIFYLLSLIAVTVVASIFTFGFGMLIKEKVKPEVVVGEQ